MTATRGFPKPTIEDWLLALTPTDGQHYPYEVDVDLIEDVGSRLIPIGHERQIRCGCEDSLAHDWGVEEHIA